MDALRAPVGNLIGSDTELIEEARRLALTTRADRKLAKKHAFMWLLILSTFEGTIPSDILARMSRTAPTRRDQVALVKRLRDEIAQGERESRVSR
jgi:hypothetical protein